MTKTKRFRCWLIKRLGGSTEPLFPLASHPPIIAVERVNMVPVRVVGTCNLQIVGYDAKYRERMRANLAEEMGYALLENGHIRFEEQEDIQHGEYRIIGTVTLAKREREETNEY